jgi:hypothetical protein
LGAAFIDGIGKPHEFEGQVSARVGKRLAQARYAERGAWRASDEDIGTGNPVLVTEQRKIPVQRHIRVVMGEHRPGEGLDLGEGQRPEAKRVPGDSCSLDS